MSDLKVLYQSVIEGNASAVKEQIEACLAKGSKPEEILNDGMVSAMAEVGRLFEEGEYFVPEMLVSARAMKGGLAILRPYLAQANVKSAGKVLIGTVQGDLHDIGKNLVAMMLEGAGFEVVDLGTDISAVDFVKAAQEKKADIIALSALLTTTMPRMKETVETLKMSGMRSSVKIMIGGAPVTQKYADDIGADGFSADASRAVLVAKELLNRG
jgi:5-methyltetrahydrofolate--homocysteine methyltransferase